MRFSKFCRRLDARLASLVALAVCCGCAMGSGSFGGESATGEPGSKGQGPSATTTASSPSAASTQVNVAASGSSTAIGSSTSTGVAPVCNNGILEGAEACDGSALGGKTCADFGFAMGTLECNEFCSIVVTGCSNGSSSTGVSAVCGNGVIEFMETCDGSDFGGKTCASFGFLQGFLSCNTLCSSISTAACFNVEDCDNSNDDDNDSLTDCADPDCAAELACVDPCAAATETASTAAVLHANGKPNLLVASCGSGGGEQVFRAVAPISGYLSAHILGGDHGGTISVRTECQSAASEVGCTHAPPQKWRALNIPVLAGETYYVIFEGKNDDILDFGFEVFPPEVDCEDDDDDNADLTIDCEDPSCQPTASCNPGLTPYGEACVSHSECAATGRDPFCRLGFCTEYCNPDANDCTAPATCDEGFYFTGTCE